jgi:hypothetical protein
MALFSFRLIKVKAVNFKTSQAQTKTPNNKHTEKSKSKKKGQNS